MVCGFVGGLVESVKREIGEVVSSCYIAHRIAAVCVLCGGVGGLVVAKARAMRWVACAGTCL